MTANQTLQRPAKNHLCFVWNDSWHCAHEEGSDTQFVTPEKSLRVICPDCGCAWEVGVMGVARVAWRLKDVA